jgi:hypothetical protein
MRELNRAATAWLRDHHATISSDVLADSGMTVDQRRRMVAAGTIERVVNGSYRFTGASEDPWTNAAALCAGRDDVAITGSSAARYWGIVTGISPADVTRFVTGPEARPTRARWARFYRTASFDPRDVFRRSDGLLVVSPSRAVVDLARELAADALAYSIESAIARRLVTIATLRSTGERAAAAGARHAHKFLRVLCARFEGGPRESRWEQWVMKALVARGVRGLVSQGRETLAGYGVVRFDLVVDELRWVVEVDVHPRHLERAGRARDHRRDRHGRWAGWQTERVGEVELETAFDRAMDELAHSYRLRQREVEALRTAGLWLDR